jgi:hypothetical protein
MEERHGVKMQDSRIANEMIEEMQSRVGVRIRTDNAISNEEATRMAIVSSLMG